MKKWISERKFDQLYDRCSDGLVNEDGKTFAPENFSCWMDRVSALSENNRVLGLRTLLGRIKNGRSEWQLRHLKLGNVRFPDKQKQDFLIDHIPRDLLRQLNGYLAVIIRDYLRTFQSSSPVIGNCVIEDNPNGTPYDEAACFRNDLQDEYEAAWNEKLTETADEFDRLSKMVNCFPGDEGFAELNSAERKALAQKAFADLAFIFDDLEW